MYHFLAPLEGRGLRVVDRDELVNRCAHLPRRRKAGAAQGGPRHDAEPEFMVQPARVGGRVVEMHVLVSRRPAITLGLVRVEVVEDDVDLDVFGVVGDDLAAFYVRKGCEPTPRVRGIRYVRRDTLRAPRVSVWSLG